MLIGGRLRRRGGDRGGAVGNAMASKENRPVVKTGIVRRNKVKAVASISKGFAIATSPSGPLSVSCVKCGGGSIHVNTSPAIEVTLRRSTRIVSRMVIVKCNSGAGQSIASSVKACGPKRIGIHRILNISRLLRKHMSKIGVASTSKIPKDGGQIDVHKVNSVATNGRPLCMVSKMPVGGASKSANT